MADVTTKILNFLKLNSEWNTEKGADKNNDGIVTANEFYSYLKDNITLNNGATAEDEIYAFFKKFDTDDSNKKIKGTTLKDYNALKQNEIEKMQKEIDNHTYVKIEEETVKTPTTNEDPTPEDTTGAENSNDVDDIPDETTDNVNAATDVNNDTDNNGEYNYLDLKAPDFIKDKEEWKSLVEVYLDSGTYGITSSEINDKNLYSGLVELINEVTKTCYIAQIQKDVRTASNITQCDLNLATLLDKISIDNNNSPNVIKNKIDSIITAYYKTAGFNVTVDENANCESTTCTAELNQLNTLGINYTTTSTMELTTLQKEVLTNKLTEALKEKYPTLPDDVAKNYIEETLNEQKYKDFNTLNSNISILANKIEIDDIHALLTTYLANKASEIQNIFDKNTNTLKFIITTTGKANIASGQGGAAITLKLNKDGTISEPNKSTAYSTYIEAIKNTLIEKYTKLGFDKNYILEKFDTAKLNVLCSVADTMTSYGSYYGIASYTINQLAEKFFTEFDTLVCNDLIYNNKNYKKSKNMETILTSLGNNKDSIKDKGKNVTSIDLTFGMDDDNNIVFQNDKVTSIYKSIVKKIKGLYEDNTSILNEIGGNSGLERLIQAAWLLTYETDTNGATYGNNNLYEFIGHMVDNLGIILNSIIEHPEYLNIYTNKTSYTDTSLTTGLEYYKSGNTINYSNYTTNDSAKTVGVTNAVDNNKLNDTLDDLFKKLKAKYNNIDETVLKDLFYNAQKDALSVAKSNIKDCPYGTDHSNYLVEDKTKNWGGCDSREDDDHKIDMRKLVQLILYQFDKNLYAYLSRIDA